MSPRIASPLTPGGHMRGLVTLDELKMSEYGRWILGSTGYHAFKR